MTFFEFDSKPFKQICETAIGKKFAPSYAILFIANLEENILIPFLGHNFYLGTWKGISGKIYQKVKQLSNNKISCWLLKRKYKIFKFKYKISRWWANDRFVC